VKDRLFAWTGDGNNVLHSLVEASARFSFRLNIAVPEGSEPGKSFLDWADAHGGRVALMRSAERAVEGADCVVTDTWVSMGQEHRARGHNVFVPYQVNEALMARAAPDALFMHCLPAHRGEEVTDAVIDGPHSVVFDEAENRLHAQKAVLAWCFGA
jgi:ornithine carbamoyltransferase